MDTAARNEFITDSVNEMFSDVGQGFVNRNSEPAMVTPTTVGIAEVAITGSTICLVC